MRWSNALGYLGEKVMPDPGMDSMGKYPAIAREGGDG